MTDTPDIASPALAQIRGALVDAHASRTPLRITGSGTWLRAGRPVSAPTTLSTRALRGVVEYVPGDLVISVRAGTTLREIAEVTAEHDQWLALDPFGHTDSLDDVTIGATIATASSGPLSHGFGRVRDLVLGLSFLSGDGTAVRAGGRVVKNVAGFDLVRLSTGAWGTLGVITDASLRLHARPAVDRSFVVCLDDVAADGADIVARRLQRYADVVARLNTAPLLAVSSTLSSMVLLAGASPAYVAAAHGGSSAMLRSTSLMLVVRAMGNATRVNAQRDALATLGDVMDIDPSVWRTIRALPHGATSVRLSGAPMESANTFARAAAWLERHATPIANAHVIIEPLRGIVRVMSDLGADGQHAFDLPARAIAECLPERAWAMQRTAIADPISQQLRRVFDPASILNPGILGESYAVAEDAP